MEIVVPQIFAPAELTPTCMRTGWFVVWIVLSLKILVFILTLLFFRFHSITPLVRAYPKITNNQIEIHSSEDFSRRSRIKSESAEEAYNSTVTRVRRF